MYEICVDENGYYMEGVNGNFVFVEEIPYVEDVRLLKAYRYDNGALVKDEKKYEEIKAEVDFDHTIALSAVSLEQKNIELEERIAYIEKLIEGREYY